MPKEHVRLHLPRRILKRWCECGRSDIRVIFSEVLAKAQIKPAEFKKCWRKVKGTIPDNELFHLFDKARGQFNRSGKEYFVQDIMRRYKVTGEPVRLRGIVAAVCLSVCLRVSVG